jgi:hypothetical protein
MRNYRASSGPSHDNNLLTILQYIHFRMSHMVENTYFDRRKDPSALELRPVEGSQRKYDTYPRPGTIRPRRVRGDAGYSGRPGGWARRFTRCAVTDIKRNRQTMSQAVKQAGSIFLSAARFLALDANTAIPHNAPRSQRGRSE